MNKKSNLAVVAQPEAFFKDLVTQALGNQRVSTSPETEVYLVKLLGHFVSSENLFSRDGSGHVKDEPLALLLKEAFEQENPDHQRLIFRHIGDLSLYTAGFFQESLDRKGVGLSYYVDVGGTAYGKVAESSGEKVARNMFSELGERFRNFVDVYSEVHLQTVQKDEKNLVRLYEHWTRTKSELAEKTLKDAGILPATTSSKRKLQS